MAEETTLTQEQTTENQQQPATGPDNSLAEYFNSDPTKGGMWTNDDGSFWNEGKLYDRSGNEIKQNQQQQQQTNAQSDKQQSLPQQEKPQEQGSTQQPEGFESLLYETKDGKPELSIEKSMEFFGKTGQQAYQPIYQQTVEKQQQQMAGDPNAAKTEQEKKLDWMQELDQTRERLHSEKLAFLEHFYASHKDHLSPEAVSALDAQYRAEQKRIDDHIRAMERKHFDEALKDAANRKDPEIEAQKLDENFKRTFSSVAQEFGGSKALDALLFGTRDAQGNVKKGIGADVVDWLFDLTHDASQLQGKDIVKYFPEWAKKTFSNENNLRQAARLSTALYVMNNLPKYRDGFRSAWEKEQSQKREATVGRPTGIPTNQGSKQSIDPSLQQYLYGPQTVDTV